MVENRLAETKRGGAIVLAAAWLVVVLPTLWGLSYTVRNAMKLFAPQPAAVAAPATTGTAPVR